MQGLNKEDYERIHLQEMIFLGEERMRIEEEYYEEYYEELKRNPAKIIVNVNQDTYESIEIQKHY
jgi:sulfur carrier protein ThiS